MSPREVIARAIFHADYDEDESWDGCPDLHHVYVKMADAVIDALEGMKVTDLMHARVEWWMSSDETITELWRAMVGAMRDE